MSDQYPTWIRRRGTLGVVPAPNFLSAPAWGLAFFNESIRVFNTLLQVNRLPFRLETPSDSLFHLLFPQIIVQSHNGSGQFVNQKGEITPVTFPSRVNTYVGHTVSVNAGGTPLDPGFFRQQSFVFMPVSPSIGGTQVGARVRMSVLLHEYVHAAGLGSDDSRHGDGEHLPAAPRDVFTSGGFFSHSSSDPDGERDFVSLGDTRSPLSDGSFAFSGLTVGALEDAWKVGKGP